jgi:hypothetical protein
VQRFFEVKHPDAFLIFNLCKVCVIERASERARERESESGSTGERERGSAGAGSSASWRGRGRERERERAAAQERDYDKELFDGRVERIEVPPVPHLQWKLRWQAKCGFSELSLSIRTIHMAAWSASRCRSYCGMPYDTHSRPLPPPPSL